MGQVRPRGRTIFLQEINEQSEYNLLVPSEITLAKPKSPQSGISQGKDFMFTLFTKNHLCLI